MPTVAARRPKLDDAVVRRLVDELLNDATLWDINDIAHALGVERKPVEKLARVAANYLDGGATQWPPAGEMLRQRLTPRGHATGLAEWPPDFAVLPPPATPPGERPRWRAGDVRRWAMQVGRMTVDGTPVPPSGQARRGFPARVPEDGPRPTLDPVQIERVQALCDDETLWTWTQADIVIFFDMTQPRVAQLAATTREVIGGQWRHWPPLGEQHDRGRKADEWAPLLSVLPPPVTSHKGGHMVWRAGDVIRWGLTTGRITIDWLLDWASEMEES